MNRLRAYLNQESVIERKSLVPRDRNWRLWCISIGLAVVTLACNLGQSPVQPTPNRVRIKWLAPATPTTIVHAPETISPDTIVEPTSTLLAPVTPSIQVTEEYTVVPDLESQQNRTTPTLTALVVLNVRSGPATDFPAIGQLQPGQTVKVVGKNQAGTWWQVIYPSGSDTPAWVSADPQYATTSDADEVLIAQAPSLPTATPVLVEATQTPLLALPSPTLSTDSLDTPVPPASDSAWGFANIRLDANQFEDGLVLYGNIINNTGASQELYSVTGIFYDDQNQPITDEESTNDYCPVEIVPPGGQVPFELMVFDVQSIADFNLTVETQPSDITPSVDFAFLDLQPLDDDIDYCLEGMLKNEGQDLEGVLTVIAVLYDDQDQVINFGDDPFVVDTFKNGDDEAFFVCADPLGQPVARYELLAWGL